MQTQSTSTTSENLPIKWDRKKDGLAWGKAWVYKNDRKKRLWCNAMYVSGPAFRDGAEIYTATVIEPAVPVPMPADREPDIADNLLAHGYVRVPVTDPLDKSHTPKHFASEQEARQAAEARLYALYPHLKP